MIYYINKLQIFILTVFLAAISIAENSPEKVPVDFSPAEIELPEKVTYEWIAENRDWLEAHAIMHCPKGEPRQLGISER